uniref:Mediator of RNA polymerase II transcription subunit 29 n=1 Tax=Arion vulgaris TaxID=1028688 RepID=A0A0B7A280_9EUPU
MAAPGLGGQMSGPGQMPVSVLPGMHSQQGGMVSQGIMMSQGGGMVSQGMGPQGGGMGPQGGGMGPQGGGMGPQGGGMIPQSGGMGPQGGMAGMMVPVQTNPQVQPAAIQTAEIDPIAKFKSLLPRLKESLVNLFKTGGHLFYQNATQDETGVQYEHVSGKFEKCLEEFYAICDQIEICLCLAHEIIQQDKDSTRNTPNPVLSQKSDAPQPEGQLYSQYLSTVRAQISCAKDIRDLLHECMKNFPEHTHP